MLQSIFIYVSLATFMIMCGVYASYKEEFYNNNRMLIGKETENRSFLFSFETFAPLFVFAIIFGCRYNVGVDYPRYLEDYVYGSSREWEFLFGWISKIMSKAGVHYAFYFGLWAFIQVFLIFYTFRNQRFLFPFIAFFLIFGSYYLSMMNVIRHQLAACIFIYSIQFIYNKNVFKYYLSIFIAFLFHKSAWLLIIVYPIFQLQKDWFPKIKWQFFLYTIALYLHTEYDLVVRLITLPYSFFSSFAGYDNYLIGILYNEKLNNISQFGNNTGLGIYISLFLSSVIIAFSNKMKKYYNSSFFLIIYSLWFIRILADFILGESIILNRPFVYVYNFKFIMLAYFVNYCFKTRDIIYHILAILFILIHLALFINVLSNGEVNTSMFRFFWQK